MSIANQLEQLEDRISAAALRSGRKLEDISLVAVSKKQSLSKILEFCELQDRRNKPIILGENYVQEFRDKKPQIHSKIESHLIGPLQRNKAKLAVNIFDSIESIDSEQILKEINKEAFKIKKNIDIFIQINISEDPAKSGFLLKNIDDSFYQLISSCDCVKIKGLMTITENYNNPEDARKDYSKLRVFSEIFAQKLSLDKCCLSMGMSDDFEVAIEEGATHVRIGSALFGQRQE